MFFEDETRITIALATSADGRTWTRHPGSVLQASVPWEQHGVTRPEVVTVPGGYLMAYATATQTSRGFAWSTDGVTWTKSAPGPTVSHDMFSATDQAYDHALVVRGSTAIFYLEIGRAGAGGTNVFALTATLP